MKFKTLSGIAATILLAGYFCISASAQESQETATAVPKSVSVEKETTIYPYDVIATTDESDETRRYITKFYQLTSSQTPDIIPTAEFEQDGYLFTLTDIVQNNMTDLITKTGKKTVTVESESKEIDEILKVLPQTYEFDKDGYTGTIPLNLSSIEVESKGTGYSSYTVTATREYPNLSSNDTSLIPKTTTEKGVNCSLDDVTWQSAGTENIDSSNFSATYTAIAKYSGTASYSYVKGYTVTAQYKGDVYKTDTGKTICEARFSGVKLTNFDNEETPSETTSPDEATPPNLIFLPIIIGVAFAILVTGFAIVFFRQRKQIKELKKSNILSQIAFEEIRESEVSNEQYEE